MIVIHFLFTYAYLAGKITRFKAVIENDKFDDGKK